MSLTPKENYLNAINHKETEWTPIFPVDCAGLGFGAFPGPWIEKGPMGGGYDGFGVRWITPASGGGAPIPAPNEFILDSETIVDWKNIVKFPDLEGVDWKAIVEQELSIMPVDRDQTAIEFGCGNGVFERLGALMGFEETLIALIEEPEACYELMEAITDYKIQFAKKVKEFYNPDIFNNYDDIATERGLFMSPDTYRKLIKPHHKRLNDAVRELGMIPIQHTCGLCESLIEDIIDTGAAAWSSVQPVNDIVQLLEKYGDKIAIIGGYNSNGAPGRLDATTEERLAEVHRCFDTYGSYPSYIAFPFVTVNSLDPNDMLEVMKPMLGEAIRYSHELGRK
ncbi:MAG: uroporphyrinogen decarboxylase family protein [Bacillus sp. (in: firmicutes)]